MMTILLREGPEAANIEKSQTPLGIIIITLLSILIVIICIAICWILNYALKRYYKVGFNLETLTGMCLFFLRWHATV